MTVNFFLYARKSEESEERQILSIEAQLAELKIFAEREKIHIKETFIEAMTAKKPGRPKFNEMIRRIEKGEAQGIIAWHPDRLARNSIDGGRIIYLLDTGHIDALKFPTFWFENTPQGKFMMNIAFGQSKYYVDNLSENVKRGNRQKLRNGGWPRSAPIGYLNNKADKTIFIDQLRGPIIAKLYELYSTGEYTKEDLKEFSFKLGLVSRRSERKLSSNIVNKIFTNPFYYGLMVYKNESFQGKHEPLITKELFDRVQEVLKRKGKIHEVRKHQFGYLGLASCPCGCAITAERKKGHNYYRCTKKKAPCKELYTREELLDKQISEAIDRVALPQEAYQSMLAHLEEDKRVASQTLQTEKPATERAITEINARPEKLLDLHLEGAITQQEYTSRKEKLNNKRIALEEKLAKIEEQGNVWLEPLGEFIKAAHQASQLVTSENLAAKREFLKKTGSNFRLSDRTLSFSFTFPWSLLPKSRPITIMHPREESNLRGQLRRLVL